jgi:hypothetical protein
MNKKILPWLILFCALGLSGTAAYYSIIGLSLLFSSIKIPVIIMASFLESSKLVIATLLHSYWNKLNVLLKTYLTTSVIILSFITSLGIYGLLSSGYQTTLTKANNNEQQISLLENKLSIFNTTLSFLQDENQTLNKNISDLRNGLSNNIVQYKDRQTGQIISTSSSSNRKSLEAQLELSIKSKQDISQQIISTQDSISKINLLILELKSNDEISSELGPLIFISKVTNKSMDSIVNILTLMIIFIFDPLAIALILAANHTFSSNKNTPQTIENDIKETNNTPDNNIEPDNKNENTISSSLNNIKEKMIQQLKDPSVSVWRKNKIKKQLEDDDTITYN